MSQKFIRKGAGFDWIQRLWMQFREPRILSAIYGSWYVLLAAGWTHALMMPPRTVEEELAQNLMVLVSGVLLIGSVLGIVTVLAGLYWTERTAMKVIATGLSGYLMMSIWLATTLEVNREPGIITTIGAIAFTLLRSWWIYDRPYHPDKGAVSYS